MRTTHSIEPPRGLSPIEKLQKESEIGMRQTVDVFEGGGFFVVKTQVQREKGLADDAPAKPIWHSLEARLRLIIMHCNTAEVAMW